MGDLVPALRFVWAKHRNRPGQTHHLGPLAADAYLTVRSRRIRALFAEDPEWPPVAGSADALLSELLTKSRAGKLHDYSPIWIRVEMRLELAGLLDA